MPMTHLPEISAKTGNRQAQLSLTNRAMLVCKVVEVWQDFLSEYVDKKFTYICYRRLIRHERIYYGSKNCNLQQLKIAVFTYRSPHFCFPWRRPCDYHAICCMDYHAICCIFVSPEDAPGQSRWNVA